MPCDGQRMRELRAGRAVWEFERGEHCDQVSVCHVDEFVG